MTNEEQTNTLCKVLLVLYKQDCQLKDDNGPAKTQSLSFCQQQQQFYV